MNMKRQNHTFVKTKKILRMSFRVFMGLLLFVGLVSGKPADRPLMLKGVVVDEEGKGIAGVVVNNGREFCKTDRRGAWQLSTDTTVSKFVSISTPREYRLPEKDGIASGYYIPVGEAVANRNTNTFRLHRRDSVSDRFHYIAISDPQILNAHDMKRWRNETMPSILRTALQLRKTGDVVGMTLGDVVFDNMNIYPQYVESIKNHRMTFFQCIGNHDFEKAYADLHNSSVGAERYAEQMFGRYFGPVNYSFNIGNAHVVTIKSINYRGGCHYEEEITDEDLRWLERDLSYVPKDRLVILNMHAPGWNAMEPIDNILNAKRLEEILATYDAHIFAGHTHFFENVEVSPRLYQHNIGSACGAWWTSNICRDGSPNGYMVVTVDGKKLRWKYRSANSKSDVQMRVYKPGEFRTQKDFIVANVWEWDPHCRVVWYEDGKYKGLMQRFVDNDEAFLRTKPRKHQLAKTGHLFRARPTSKKYRYIKVIFINRFGETFTWKWENRNNRPFLLDK